MSVARLRAKKKQQVEGAVTTFSVSLYEFNCVDLDERADVFLKIDFDSFKVFQTDIVEKSSSPHWGAQQTFFYTTKFPEKLSKKKLKMRLFEHSAVSTPRFIAEAEVDLHTVCTGPVEHKLYLRDGDGRVRGSLSFMAQMSYVSEDFTAVLTGIDMDYQGAKVPSALEVFPTIAEDKVVPAGVSQNMSWPGPISVTFSATLRALWGLGGLPEGLFLRVKAPNGEGVYGDAEIPFQQFVSLNGQPVDFTIDLKAAGEAVGKVRGTVMFRNVPRFGQMVGGVHNDQGIQGGQLLLDGLPLPYGAQKPTIYQSPLSGAQSPIQSASQQVPVQMSPVQQEVQQAPIQQSPIQQAVQQAPVQQAVQQAPIQQAVQQPGYSPQISVMGAPPQQPYYPPVGAMAAGAAMYGAPGISPSGPARAHDRRPSAGGLVGLPPGVSPYGPEPVRPAGQHPSVPVGAPANRIIAPRDSDDENVPKPRDPALAKIPLPPNWEERVDGTTGNVYYADHKSRSTCWVDPRFLPENWEQRVDPKTKRVYFAYHRTRQTTFTDPRYLPEEWEQRIGEDGKLYFAYHPTKQTSFLDPRGLPEGWAQAIDPNRKVYYKNHIYRSTQWEDPREQGSAEDRKAWKAAEKFRWWKEHILKAELELMRASEREEEYSDDEEDVTDPNQTANTGRVSPMPAKNGARAVSPLPQAGYAPAPAPVGPPTGYAPAPAPVAPQMGYAPAPAPGGYGPSPIPSAPAPGPPGQVYVNQPYGYPPAPGQGYPAGYPAPGPQPQYPQRPVSVQYVAYPGQAPPPPQGAVYGQQYPPGVYPPRPSGPGQYGR
eukprot:GILK01003881.1.p1 GENE.GILK01003881.1~~GILK01003881.1.p1  ORF type:complete len:831 (+),score=124.81 GILK01003881.1:42-2495(+)